MHLVWGVLIGRGAIRVSGAARQLDLARLRHNKHLLSMTRAKFFEKLAVDGVGGGGSRAWAMRQLCIAG